MRGSALTRLSRLGAIILTLALASAALLLWGDTRRVCIRIFRPQRYLEIVLEDINQNSADPTRYTSFLRAHVDEIGSQYDTMFLPAPESTDPADGKWPAPETRVAECFYRYEDYPNALFFAKHGLQTKRGEQGLLLLCEIAARLERPEDMDCITQAERRKFAWRFDALEALSRKHHDEAITVLTPVLELNAREQYTNVGQTYKWLWAWRIHAYASNKAGRSSYYDALYDDLYNMALGPSPERTLRDLSRNKFPPSVEGMFEDVGRACRNIFEGNRAEGALSKAEKWRSRGENTLTALTHTGYYVVAAKVLLPQLREE